MPRVLKKKEYVAIKDFETTLILSGNEFRQLATEDYPSGSNGLPRECLLRRAWVITKDSVLQIEGINSTLPAGKVLQDVGQAHKILRQSPDRIEIQDEVFIPEGTVLPALIGESFVSAGLPVTAVEEEPESLGFRLPEPEGLKAPPIPTAAEIKAAEKAAAKAAKEAAEKAALQEA